MNGVMDLVVRSITKDMATDEVVAVYMAATSGFDPTKLLVYEKAKDLFTEQDGKKMHTAALEALGAVVSERLGEQS